MVTRIVNQRRAGIGNQRDVLPFFQFGKQGFRLLLLIMVVKRKQTGVYRKMLQQQTGMTGIFRCN